MQRVFGLALGYEDLNDHDALRQSGWQCWRQAFGSARRLRGGPGKSISLAAPTRYHKISHDPQAIEALFVDMFLEAHRRPQKEIVLDLDATDDPVHGDQEGRFGYYGGYCYLPL